MLRTPTSRTTDTIPLRTPESVSVLIPVRNEQAYIGDLLAMLLEQDLSVARFEILVIDGMSDDRTCAIVQEFVDAGHPVRLLHNPKRLSSAARNVGVRAASGDIVLVMDGHCELSDRSHLRELLATFSKTGADCVGRPQPLTVNGASRLQRAIALARASRLGHHPDSYIYTHQDQFVPASSVGAAYRRDVFNRIGGFDESFDACEDVDFNYRCDHAGLRCFLSSAAAVNYHPRDSLLRLFEQLARYGRGRVRLWRKHPGTFSWKSMLPAACLALLSLALLLAIVVPAAGWLAAAMLALYTATIVVVSVAISLRQLRVDLLLLLPVVFATIHCGAACGSLQELLCGRSIPRAAVASFTT